MKSLSIKRIGFQLLIVFSIWGPPRFRKPEMHSVELIARGPDLAGYLQMIPLFVGAAIVYLAGIGILSTNERIKLQYVKGPPIIYLLFAVLAVFSIYVSVFPLYTLYKSSLLVVPFLLIAIYFNGYHRKWYDLFFLFIFYNFLVGVNNFLFLVTDYDSVTRYGRLIGGGLFNCDFGLAGQLLTLLGYTMVLYLKWAKSLYLKWLTFSGGLILVYLSGTRAVMITSIAAIVMISFFAILFSEKRSRAIVFVLIFVIIALLCFDDLTRILTRGGDSISTLSGRIEIWSTYLNYFKENVLFGLGYGAGSRYISSVSGVQTIAHSGWIQVLVTTGIIGFLVVFLLVVNTFYYSLRLLYEGSINYNIPAMERVLIVVTAISVMPWLFDPPFALDTFAHMVQVSIILFTLRAAYIHYRLPYKKMRKPTL